MKHRIRLLTIGVTPRPRTTGTDHLVDSVFGVSDAYI